MLAMTMNVAVQSPIRVGEPVRGATASLPGALGDMAASVAHLGGRAVVRDIVAAFFREPKSPEGGS